MNRLIFVNHEEREDEDARRQVRSRAAQHSHRVGPRKPKVSKKGRGKTRAPSSDQESTRTGMSRRGSAISVATSTASTTTREASPEEEEQPAQSSAVVTTSGSPSAAPPSSPLSRMGSYADHPFETYPVPAQPWFAEVLQYIFYQLLPRGWQALQTTPQERNEALIWCQRLTMNDSAYFLMNLLSAMSDLVSRGVQPANRIVWLNSEVVRTINQALSDRSRALAPGTVLTVGRIAFRELMVGDANAGATYHRPAYARMLAMAGGLQALGLPGLVQRHIAWADRMMTRKTGVRVSQLEASLGNDPTLNAGWERGPEQDVHVLDCYVPFRHRLPAIMAANQHGQGEQEAEEDEDEEEA